MFAITVMRQMSESDFQPLVFLPKLFVAESRLVRQRVASSRLGYDACLVHVKLIEEQLSSLGCGAEVRLGACRLRCHPRNLMMIQKCEVCYKIALV
ncbi:hypothetical protein AVEN_273427-1 [Araneus ventricosus]|uniref:Uncharacterized protein n=1 Tax=Araneus ventricosus TaxID=182803 RepID=A0A4Y2DZS0_ARAVE|nr:hypothetical protein AVEN_273427-1 [Araneus ventricosus]